MISIIIMDDYSDDVVRDDDVIAFYSLPGYGGLALLHEH